MCKISKEKSYEYWTWRRDAATEKAQKQLKEIDKQWKAYTKHRDFDFAIFEDGLRNFRNLIQGELYVSQKKVNEYAAALEGGGNS